MSIQSNKLMNLADGKLLYDDIRQRIENQTFDTATMEEIQMIIDNYGEGDDEDMLFTTHFVRDENNHYNNHFETEEDASVIINAFKQGKHVVIKIEASEDSLQYVGVPNDLYFLITGYEEGYTNPTAGETERVCRLYGCHPGTYLATNPINPPPYAAMTMGNLNNIILMGNGKLGIYVYID